MNNVPVVCYLFTSFDHENSIKEFVKNYKKYPSGLKHKLILSFKLLDEKKIDNLEKYTKDIDYIKFIDPSKINDFDFGTYNRIALNHQLNQILFLNSHSYPICENWLLKLMKYSNEKTLIATSASNESILDSIKLKKFYKIISYLFKRRYFKKRFKSFPNPHIRTSSFLINGQIFSKFMENRLIHKKEDAWEIESGFNSLTNFFKKNDYPILVINSDGEKFFEKDWKFSETYNFFNQSKSIISDKHTRKYLMLNDKEKKTHQINTWG